MPSGDDDCQKNSIITSEKKKIMTGPDLDYDFTEVRNWKKYIWKVTKFYF